jgi:fused signal recognition particle receptor
MGIFDRIKKGFAKTRAALSEKVVAIFKPGRKIDDELLAELEEVLLSGDVGWETTEDLLARLKESAREDNGRTEPEELLRRVVVQMLSDAGAPVELGTNAQPPCVILVLGVNGTGKTTTIGKLAYYYRERGKKVMLAAGDTFRAAAIDQLRIWADRTGCQMISSTPGADSAAVIFDAFEAAIHREVDYLIVDTAGRLHTKSNLMKELEKVARVLKKKREDAPHEVLLVLDATTGQNGLVQAQEFTRAIPVTGLVLTKIDGTAKGGILLSIARTLKVPIRFVGFGESLDDIALFDAEQFAAGLLGDRKAQSLESL